jgi:diguanylate cyclase (GGDEF)-like protein/PAS domain S-box-containing protein
MNLPMDAPLTNLLDLLMDAVCAVDARGHFVFVSAGFERIFGYSPDEVVGRRMIDLVHPDDRERTLQAADEIMSGQPKSGFENRYLRKDGRIVHVMWSARWSQGDGLRIAVARDVTDRKRAEAQQAAIYAISEAAHVATDLDALLRRIHEIVGGLMPARNLFVALYEAGRDELSFPYFVDEYDPAPPSGPLDELSLSAHIIRHRDAILLGPEEVPRELGIERTRLRDAARPRYWLGAPLESAAGPLGVLAVQGHSAECRYEDAERETLKQVAAAAAAAIERKRGYSRMQQIALYDALTGLPNRPLLHDRLASALARARRERGLLALLYIDLDDFKQVNDLHGHEAGDELLRTVARRLGETVRASDTVARLGGDEFVVLLESIHVAENAMMVAGKLAAALREPLVLGTIGVSAHASIGIAIHPDDGEDGFALLQQADAAMYRAKRAGGNRAMRARAGAFQDGASG